MIKALVNPDLTCLPSLTAKRAGKQTSGERAGIAVKKNIRRRRKE